MAHGSRWSTRNGQDWSQLLSGLPYDVQSALFNRLKDRTDLNPAACYRLPILFSTQRLTVNAGAQTTSSWRFLSLSAVYGISKTFDNETGGTVSAATLVYPSEVALNISFNEGATNWLGSAAEPCRLGSVGDPNHVTRMDPVVATRNDVWDLVLTGDAGLANAVFSTVCLHGVKIYNAGGAI